MNIYKSMGEINNFIKNTLKNNYVGVYFHGSLRLGSFNPNKSDLDFIIVIKDKIDYSTKELIWDWMLDNLDLFPKKGFEFSVVLESNCKNINHPIEYELHGSRDWIDKYKIDKSIVINDDIKVDPDLASHFNVINVENNKLDFGKPSKEVFNLVPIEYVVDSNYSDILDCVENIKDNPVYCILNLCRFYALVKDGLTLSKYDGGKWMIENNDTNYKQLILQAMNDYNSEINDSYNEERLDEFAHNMIKDINNILNKKNNSPIHE